jgi:hypothetical protein
MSDNPGNRAPLQVSLPGAAPIAAIASLTAALQFAIEAAIFPDRIHVERKSKRARLEALAEKIFSEVKSIPTETMSEADEAAGMRAAIDIITDITDRIRRELDA